MEQADKDDGPEFFLQVPPRSPCSFMASEGMASVELSDPGAPTELPPVSNENPFIPHQDHPQESPHVNTRQQPLIRTVVTNTPRL